MHEFLCNANPSDNGWFAGIWNWFCGLSVVYYVIAGIILAIILLVIIVKITNRRKKRKKEAERYRKMQELDTAISNRSKH